MKEAGPVESRNMQMRPRYQRSSFKRADCSKAIEGKALNYSRFARSSES